MCISAPAHPTMAENDGEGGLGEQVGVADRAALEKGQQLPTPTEPSASPLVGQPQRAPPPKPSLENQVCAYPVDKLHAVRSLHLGRAHTLALLDAPFLRRQTALNTRHHLQADAGAPSDAISASISITLLPLPRLSIERTFELGSVLAVALTDQAQACPNTFVLTPRVVFVARQNGRPLWTEPT